VNTAAGLFKDFGEGEMVLPVADPPFIYYEPKEN
jgi:hypothetical protein